MKKIAHLKVAEKAKEAVQKISKSYSQGVTQRLLDKYKPSRKFKVIEEKNLKNYEPKAA